ncbi:MAG: aminopeptidase P N-terminal domain-containing protein, partial [Gemmatimonadota bacterium]|nr:aminopeptidase P N-terminal domain-containing protein [Gemmatimonadota bacterium]
MTAFPPIPFADRRETAFTRLAGGSMLLPASEVRYKSGDSEYRYRPDSELFHLTGWEEGGTIAVLRSHGATDRFVLFVPERDEKLERWMGPRLDPAEPLLHLGR